MMKADVYREETNLDSCCLECDTVVVLVRFGYTAVAVDHKDLNLILIEIEPIPDDGWLDTWNNSPADQLFCQPDVLH